MRGHSADNCIWGNVFCDNCPGAYNSAICYINTV